MGLQINTDTAYLSYNVIEYLATAISPHASTTRATYTQAASVRGKVLSVNICLVRSTAASTPGWVHGRIVYTPSGGTARSVAGRAHNSNVTGYTEYMNTILGLILNPGDVITIQTADSSTGGACDYYITVQIGTF